MADADDELEEEVAEDAEEDGDEDGEGEGEGGRKKLSGKKLSIIAGVPLLLVLLIGGAFFSGALDGFIGGGGEKDVAEELGPPEEVHFFDLPEMLVNLNTGGNKTTFLKVKVSLEIGGVESAERLEALLPRVIDNFQVYLRELRLEDLNGSAGLFRLKQELLMRVNRAVDPIQVSDVLFREMLVQ